MMSVATVLLIAGSAVVPADATAKGEIYETAAHEYDRQGHFAECGCSMLAAAQVQPDSPKHAERLWNAGLCFQKAHNVGQTVRVRLELIQAHPKDPLAQKALLLVAAGYRHLCFDCDRHSPFPRVPWAHMEVSEEFGLAAGAAMLGDLGELEQSLARIESYAKARGPGDVALAYFEVVAVYEKNHRPDLLAIHLARYLRKWARYDAPDRQIRAHFLLGESVWRASCGKASEDGTCPEKRTTAATSALTRFRAAVKLWKEGAAASGIVGIDAESRAAEAADAVAGALFYIAEKQYEDFLRVGDTSSPPKLEAVHAMFQRVVDRRRAPWAVAAAARIGQLYKASTSVLLATKAPEAFEVCLAIATATAWHDEWARLCERELNHTNRSRYPLASEMTPEAAYDAPLKLSRTPPVAAEPPGHACPSVP